MKILISGTHGLIGSALVPALQSQGHQIVRLVRTTDPTSAEGVTWNPPQTGPDADALNGIEAVIHLAGESIASRWTERKQKAIMNSRLQGTKLLVDALLKMKEPPKTLIAASAIGLYGNRGAEVLREESAPGKGFLADVCRVWEEMTKPAAQKGIRVVNLRFGVVLSAGGGALGMMLIPFKLGVGGKVGPGTQYMSWIALEDVVGAIQFALQTPALSGPVNAVAPEAVTNLVYTKTLGRVLGRPTVFPLPAAIARLVFGKMADELLLASARVEPKKLTDKGYRFRYPRLEGALRAILKPAD